MDRHLTEQELDVFRAMTPVQRIDEAMKLFVLARDSKRAALRTCHPDWSEEQICWAVIESFSDNADG
jgi:hypothetical protein